MAAAFAGDPTGKKRKLIPVRVRECHPEGLLAQIVYIDLVGHQDAVARRLLLAGLQQRTQVPPAPPRVPNALPEIWNIPHARNPNFTGREQLLQELRASLTSRGTAAILPIAGLGGAGKTQLALEYAYRHAADYEIVWWVRAEEPVTLTAGYAKLATELGLPGKDLADQQATTAAVRSWLGHHSGWLLILDNAPHPDDCRDRLPPGAAGHVLITSRDPNWGSVAKPLKLPVLPRAEAVELLQKRCGRDEPAAAGELCGALGDLPLALEQAGAYIESTASSIAEYLALYRSHPRELLNDAVAATWQISFERLQTEAPEALDLLYLTAFLAPDDIDPKLVSPAFPDAMQFNDAKAALRRYSLIDVGKGSIAVHRLVQAATRGRLTSEEQEQKWAEAALKLVNSSFPFDEFVVGTWTQSGRVLPHALAAAGHTERLGAMPEWTGRMLNQAGLYLNNRGQLEEARQILRRSLRLTEKVYGADHPNVASVANNIGLVLRAQGDLPGALEQAQRALEIAEKVHGPEHPDVAINASNIGAILQAQGDLAGALRYTQRALAIDERVHGPEHPNVAIRANNIGEILRIQGDFLGAMEFARRALAIDEKIYGPDHPNVAIHANVIGQILKAQGDLAGAMHHTQRALAIDERVFGPDHPNVAREANNIASILQAKGDLFGAVQYMRRALQIFRVTYGPNNPLTKIAVQNLAILEQELAKRGEGTPPATD